MIGDPRPARQRRTSLARSLRLLFEWIREPFDYHFITDYHSTRPLHTIITSVIGAGILVYAAASVAMLASPLGPRAGLPTAWVLFVLVVQLAVATYWFAGPLPGRTALLAFGLFADLGLSSVLVLYRPLAALNGCVLFAVAGAFFTYFVSQRWLVAHLVWSVGFIYAMAFRIFSEGLYDTATVVAITIVLLGAVAGVPMFAHMAWIVITRDARRAELDPLTGLYNRRGWDSALTDLWARGHAEHHALAVILVDIDKFKQVNDKYGHDVGDEVIVLLARRLEELFGAHGIMARTGGEEFLAAITGDAGMISALAERLRDVVDNGTDQVPVTVSIGVARLSADSDQWSAGESIVVRAGRVADSMMYRAKDAGGNRVFTADL
ncbi:MAG: GGDEF domain-containing protein [Rhodococcus sp. (in: high G+C Gram-positive bacteria)]